MLVETAGASMLDNAIQKFLIARKEKWLKSRTSQEEDSRLKEEADQQFAFENWLPAAANRAYSLSIVSHPPKFSDPSAKTSPVLATCCFAHDGYLRTGNVQKTNLDVIGNASAMDVYAFLSIQLSDGKTVLDHLENKTPYIKKQFAFAEKDSTYAEMASSFLQIKLPGNNQFTSPHVNQVFFPVAVNEYHLLSVLTPSPLIFALKYLINDIRFSEETKIAREARRNNELCEHQYAEIHGLTVIGYGGSKPQNISVLNSANGGTAYLLESLPPSLRKRTITLPRRSIFINTLRKRNYLDQFNRLHNILSATTTNSSEKNQCELIIKDILFLIIETVWQIRVIDAGWSKSDHYQNLPIAQKIWLDQTYSDIRQTEANWIDDIKMGLANWIIDAFKEFQANKSTVDVIDDLLSTVPLMRLIDECEEILK